MTEENKMGEKKVKQLADEYCRSVGDDCLCQRTNPGTPVGEHIYCFCGCHIHAAFIAGFDALQEKYDKEKSEHIKRELGLCSDNF